MPPPIGFQRTIRDVLGAGEEKQGICSSLQRICILTGHVLWPALRAAGGTGGPLLLSCKRVTGFAGFQKGGKPGISLLFYNPPKGEDGSFLAVP